MNKRPRLRPTLPLVAISLLFVAGSVDCSGAKTEGPPTWSTPTQPLDATLTGHPDADSSRAGNALVSGLSPTEFQYLSQLDWRKATPEGLRADRVFLKAVHLVAPVVQADRGCMPSRWTLGVAFADGNECVQANDGLKKALAAIVAKMSSNPVAAFTCLAAMEGAVSGPADAPLVAACVGAVVLIAGHEVAQLLAATVQRALSAVEGCAAASDQPVDPELQCQVIGQSAGQTCTYDPGSHACLAADGQRCGASGSPDGGGAGGNLTGPDAIPASSVNANLYYDPSATGPVGPVGFDEAVIAFQDQASSCSKQTFPVFVMVSRSGLQQLTSGEYPLGVDPQSGADRAEVWVGFEYTAGFPTRAKYESGSVTITRIERAQPDSFTNITAPDGGLYQAPAGNYLQGHLVGSFSVSRDGGAGQPQIQLIGSFDTTSFCLTGVK